MKSEALLDHPPQQKYFVVNESNESKIEFEYEAPVKHEVREQKGSKGILYMFISAMFYTVMATLLKVLYLNSNISTYEVTYF